MNQASALAQPVPRQKPVKVIAVASGKGGVGKTSVSVNLATAMALAGKRTMLLDADLGLANVDVMLGLQPVYNLAHLLNGDCSINDLILEGPHGLKIVPATSGTRRMAQLSQAENAGLIRAFCDYGEPLDTLIVDTAAGIADSVTMFCSAAQEVAVVICDDPASITDAYALIKVLSREYGVQRFRIIANRVPTLQHGRDLFTKIVRVADRFLDVTLDFSGAIPDDYYLQRAVRRQMTVVDAYPASRSALAFKNLAQATDKWIGGTGVSGHLEFFVERRTRAEASEVEQ
ncbi:MinD/ParA family protein [Dokdonella sp. MW10]|uniref:MinD/ParA family protein n=1 Tax=Dokdonella sp. MW10 TaxID=2992926 RepID=UPI003F81E7F5